MRAAGFFVFAVVSGGVLFFFFETLKYTRMISNIFLSLIYRPGEIPVVNAPRGEPVAILDSADEEIPALLLRRKGSRAVVIFSHESGAGKESWERYAYFLPEKGLSVLSVGAEAALDEGEENTLSQWPTVQDVKRLVTVIRWAKKAFRPGTPIILFGVSKGADVSLAASFHDAQVRAVVADGLFSMRAIFCDYIRKWAPILVKPNFFGENYPEWVVQTFAHLGFWYSQRRSDRKFIDVEACLRRRHAPLLMIHGEKDDYVSPLHQAALGQASAHSAAVRHMVVPRAGHNQAVLIDRERYQKAVMEFLEAVL